jgi:hypothetical protein
MNTSTFRNEFHRYTRTIRHRGDVPAYSTIARHIRASRPRDCRSTWTLTRDDGVQLIAIPAHSYGEGNDLKIVAL